METQEISSEQMKRLMIYNIDVIVSSIINKN